jgi:hypothetical protein
MIVIAAMSSLGGVVVVIAAMLSSEGVVVVIAVMSSLGGVVMYFSLLFPLSFASYEVTVLLRATLGGIDSHDVKCFSVTG